MLIELHEKQKTQIGLSISIDEALLLISTLTDQTSRTFRHGMDSWEQTAASVREFKKKYDWKDYPGALVTHVRIKND